MSDEPPQLGSGSKINPGESNVSLLSPPHHEALDDCASLL